MTKGKPKTRVRRKRPKLVISEVGRGFMFEWIGDDGFKKSTKPKKARKK